ncbi:hypothetical protein Tco_1086733 [Tanacetum coccineum]
MSSPNYPTSDIEDAFSSNFPDYIPASPDYVRIEQIYKEEPSKKGKHEHGKSEEHKRIKDSKRSQEKTAPLAGRKTVKLGFALIALTKEAHMSLSRIAKLAIRVSSIVIQGP